MLKPPTGRAGIILEVGVHGGKETILHRLHEPIYKIIIRI
jgi:hypothetical protein